MLVNWKRRIFVIISIILCYLDLASDILYYFFVAKELTIVILLCIQPGIYIIYFWLRLMTSAICKDESASFINLIYSCFCRAPLYLIFCELKLMLTPLCFLVNHIDKEDRIKHDFLSHILAHSLLQSLPMGVYQIVYSITHHSCIISYISPAISVVMVLHGIFVIDLIKRMNTGGLNWIQTPKPTIQFYSMAPANLLDYDYN
jgi:hypothetical protein